MEIVEAVNILLLEREVKQEELKVFPDNQHLKNIIDAMDILCDIAMLYAISVASSRKVADSKE